MKSLTTHSTSCTGYYLSVHANLQDLIPTLALVVCDAYNHAAKVVIKSCRFDYVTVLAKTRLVRTKTKFKFIAAVYRHTQYLSIPSVSSAKY